MRESIRLDSPATLISSPGTATLRGSSVSSSRLLDRVTQKWRAPEVTVSPPWGTPGSSPAGGVEPGSDLGEDPLGVGRRQQAEHDEGVAYSLELGDDAERGRQPASTPESHERIFCHGPKVRGRKGRHAVNCPTPDGPRSEG